MQFLANIYCIAMQQNIHIEHLRKQSLYIASIYIFSNYLTGSGVA